MAAVTPVWFPAIGQSATERKCFSPSSSAAPECNRFRPRFLSTGYSRYYGATRRSNTSVSSHPRFVIQCMSYDVPTVAETKSNFLKAYKKPIPSVYNSVLQELLVQQHLTKYQKTYGYDAVFALGLVTVYDQLMDGYPSEEDRDAIFRSYIQALNEDPEQYRADAKKLEEWARSQNSSSLVEFEGKEGEIEGILKAVANRSKNGQFHYSRFFAVGLFRLLELSNSTEPAVLEKLCACLNVNKKGVDRDLDVYRNLLTKLVQAKELLREYVDREKKKREERSEQQKANEALKK